MTEFPIPMSGAFIGTSLDNPATSQTYRKAVIRPAPLSFTVSICPPTKQGSSIHYGMRVFPVEEPGSPVRSSARSARSTKTTKLKEYEIWRRWEDCLDFQRTLEEQYEIVARRRRKGQPAFNHQAKNVLYPAQRAASFDSLPVGPDPNTISSDVHSYIPKLSKKTTIFKANQTTITQRGEEFKAMIEALLSEDAHSTIQELRTLSLVRDFFAIWRRDKEAERKAKALSGVPAPPLPEPTKPPATAPGPSTPQNQAVTQHLVDFLHTPGVSVPKSPRAVRNSYAPPRPVLAPITRPHTANNEEPSLRSSRSATTFSSSTAELSPNSGVPFATAPSSSIPARFSRSQSIPFEGPNSITENFTGVDAVSRKEPLVFRALAREESVPRRSPIRKGSTPELSRVHPERRPGRDLSPLSRNVEPTAGGISADVFHPMPVPILSQRQVSQSGRARKATLRDTQEEIESITPLTSFPFDHPPEALAAPVATNAPSMGRTGGLAVLDPEMYHSLSSQQAQAPPLPMTPSPGEGHQVIPRARKTPPIIDTGNRSARFFVDDPTGLVDVSGAPPPRSPINPSLTVRPDFYESQPPEEDGEQFGQIAHLAQRKAMKLSQPPPSKLVFPLPPVERPNYDENGRGQTTSVISGSSAVPTLSSPSWSSQQISPVSQRYRSRTSLISVAERRLSLDSLIASEFELPYLSRNISTPQLSHQNKSSDAVFNPLNALTAPSITPTQRGRTSYSSQETDSTGLEENSGAVSSGSSLYGRGVPPSKGPHVVPKSTPPPRPPRSALRNSSQFTTGVIQRLNESLAANDESAHTPSARQEQAESLEFPPSPIVPNSHLELPFGNRARPRESGMSSVTNFAQYYHSIPDNNGATGTNELSSLPPTPFTPSFDFKTPTSNSGTVPIKAVHAHSETIVLFKVSRADTTLENLRSKIVKRFKEAEGLDLNSFELKYFPPRKENLTGGRQRSISVTSTSDISSMVNIDSEEEWQKALQANNKIVIRII